MFTFWMNKLLCKQDHWFDMHGYTVYNNETVDFTVLHIRMYPKYFYFIDTHILFI